MIEVRRILTQVEDIHHEFGPPPPAPLRRGAIAAVLTNPYAGRYEPDIVPMMDALNPLGLDMARRLLAAMDVAAERIETYGKGSIVGKVPDLSSQLVFLQGAGNDRVTIARSLLSQASTLQSIVDGGFMAVLRRHATAAETQLWTSQMQTGQVSAGDFMRKLMASSELGKPSARPVSISMRWTFTKVSTNSPPRR